MSSEERAESGRAQARYRRRWALLAVVAGAGFVADLVTKIIATAALEPAEPVKLLGGAVYFQLVRNPNAAFGLGGGLTPVLTVFAILVVVAITWFASRIRSAGWAVGLGLVLAGALGNLADRLFRAPGPFEGHVIDFVSLFAPNGEVWPVFNVADSCIVVGAALVVLLSLFGRDYDGNSVRQTRRRDATGEHERASGQAQSADDVTGVEGPRE